MFYYVDYSKHPYYIKIMPNESAYSDEDLVKHAKQFSTRKEWELFGHTEVEEGKPSHHRVAYKRGSDFYRVCCAHMPDMRGTHGTQKYSDIDLVTSAKPYAHKGEWKTACIAQYQAARRRPEIFLQATAHMSPAEHPYSGSYVIYAFLFSDNSAYVGLTFRLQERYQLHMQRGAVFTHIKKCKDYTLKILEHDIESPSEAASKEAHWVKHHQDAGWHMLNSARAGGLGTVQVTKWTKEAILTQARLYSTKQEWINKSQMSYRLAKRNGWFEEACAHMPKRDARHLVGRSISKESRAKMSAAKTGKTLTPEHRAKISAAIKAAWATLS